jgi:hypothetical protein
MKSVFRGVLAVCAVLVASAASAAVVSPGQPVLITQVYAYSSFGGGDFVFSTSIAASGCASGWYVKTTDPGYNAIVASVLTAQAVGLQVIVYGDNANIWNGSTTGQYCRVQTIGPTS